MTDHVNVNCDAAFNPVSGNGGWGCVLRDADSDVVAAFRGRVNNLCILSMVSSLHAYRESRQQLKWESAG
uniref:RNase H type-1 domain-containing protein n=1 Tax=Oryza sativa subsp. japonica TaxID=39947 RepID=Q6YSD2_ORYSJ|nr:hypothetical protein [Oryza sativa Japonica Group]